MLCHSLQKRTLISFPYTIATDSHKHIHEIALLTINFIDIKNFFGFLSQKICLCLILFIIIISIILLRNHSVWFLLGANKLGQKKMNFMARNQGLYIRAVKMRIAKRTAMCIPWKIPFRSGSGGIIKCLLKTFYRKHYIVCFI